MTVVSRQGCAPAAPGGGPTLVSGGQPARKSRLVRVCVGPTSGPDQSVGPSFVPARLPAPPTPPPSPPTQMTHGPAAAGQLRSI